MIDIKSTKASILSFAYRGELSIAEGDGHTNKGVIKLHSSIKKYEPVQKKEELISVPDHWIWSRLGYVTSNHGQKTPAETFCYIDVGSLDNVNHSLSIDENVIEASKAPSRAKKVVQRGDVLYSTVRPYLHNICIVDKDFSNPPIASTAFCVMSVDEKVLNNKFLFYWLLTREFDRFSNGDPSKGALYPAIGEKDLLKGVIPIPTLHEQAVIVEKIESAFDALDQIQKALESLEQDSSSIKTKIINAGIRGELTEQLPGDGTAEELYQQIRVEKASLIKEKKIKKTKLLPEITEEEMPFDIPNNWKWVRLGNIVEVLGGKRIPAGRKLTSEDTGHKYIRVSEMKNRSVITDGLLNVPEDIYPKISQYIINKEDVYITVAGTIGRVGKIPPEIDGANLTENADRLVFSNLNQDWLIYCLESRVVQRQIEMLTTQVAQPKLAIKRIQDFAIPLPPLAEQKRIATKINDLLEAMMQ